MQIEQLYNIYLQHSTIVTDTRKLQPNCIFVALKGNNFNGNLFAQQALQNGAAYAIIDEEIDTNNKQLIKVDDALKTLQQLALHHRQQFNIPFIAITGSNGKTTTKELVNCVLQKSFKTYATKGNLNNHIGIPLTILSIKKDAEITIIEMGANHQKEIENYCTYTLPTHGIITNCGKAHLEGFGGIEGVKKGKGELFDFLRNNNGVAFACSDYDYLKEMSNGIKNIIWYGTKDGKIIGNAIENNYCLKANVSNGLQQFEVNTNLVGNYNLPNVLCAVTVANYFKVDTNKIVDAIENYSPTNNRSQQINWQGNEVILDAYNANPTSMKAAIENFANLQGNNKFLLMGGMMEMGEFSMEEHQKIVDLINQYNFKNVVLVGGDFEKTNHSFQYFKTSTEAKEYLKSQAVQGFQILIKGSRSMAMEKIIE